MKKIVPVLAVLTACFGLPTLPVTAHAAPWGNEPHHEEMATHHREIAPHMNDANEALRACAREASRRLNNNDWSAAQGPRESNPGPWAERAGIMFAYTRCAASATGADETATTTRGAYGSQPHHIEMQRNHYFIAQRINDPDEGFRTCAVTASQGLNKNDPAAAAGPKESNSGAWEQRERIMWEYVVCTKQREAAIAEHQRQVAGAVGEVQRDRAEVARAAASSNICLQGCAKITNAALDGNDWQAKLGYGNVIPWNERRQLMRDFRFCVRQGEARVEEIQAGYRKCRRQYENRGAHYLAATCRREIAQGIEAEYNRGYCGPPRRNPVTGEIQDDSPPPRW